jgi:hypothetical protein
MGLRTARRSGGDYPPITSNGINNYKTGLMNPSAIIRAGDFNTLPWNDNPAFYPSVS